MQWQLEISVLNDDDLYEVATITYFSDRGRFMIVESGAIKTRIQVGSGLHHTQEEEPKPQAIRTPF
jgi:hypothetical protein